MLPGEKLKKLEEEKGIIMRFVIGHRLVDPKLIIKINTNDKYIRLDGESHRGHNLLIFVIFQSILLDLFRVNCSYLNLIFDCS